MVLTGTFIGNPSCYNYNSGDRQVMASGHIIIKVCIPSIELKEQIRSLASAQGLSMSEFLLAPILGQANHHRSLVRAEGALLNPQTYARLVEVSQALRNLSPGSSINSGLLQEVLLSVEATARDILFSRSDPD
jgi:hypothetical protein